MPVDTVMPDTFESCLDAMMCGNDCDFLNGLYSLDVIDIMHLAFSVLRLVLLCYYYYYYYIVRSFTPTRCAYYFRWCVRALKYKCSRSLHCSRRRCWRRRRCPCRCRRHSINFEFYLFWCLLLRPPLSLSPPPPLLCDCSRRCSSVAIIIYN